eukprot:9775365-Alexandrium_andersonii.AAC.1
MLPEQCEPARTSPAARRQARSGYFPKDSHESSELAAACVTSCRFSASPRFRSDLRRRLCDADGVQIFRTHAT